jgi:hypothetical protein
MGRVVGIVAQRYTDSWVDHMRLIIVLSHVGRIEEARAEVPAALKLRPDMSVHEYDRWGQATLH